MAEAQMLHIFGSDSEAEDGPQEAGDGEAQEPADDEQGPGAAREVMRDVFGSEDEEEEEQPAPRPASPPPDDDDQEGYPGGSQRQEDRRPSGPPMVLEVPLHDSLGAGAIRLVRLSNILGLEPRAFDADTFEVEASEYTDEMGRKRIKLKDQNTIRWRWAPGPDGEQVRQSNARFVRWSDGSLQLWLGDEVLDAKEIDISGDHSYAFVRHQQLIQNQGQLQKKMVLQPSSLASSFHKRLTAAVDRQHARQNKVRATTTMDDPKKRKEEAARAEEQRIKEREKLLEKQAKQMRKFAAPRQARGMLSSAFLEEEEDMYEEGEGLAEDMADAQRARLGQQRRALDEEAEAENARRLASAKAGAPPAAPGVKRGRTITESDEEISGEEGEDEMKDFIVDEEEEEARKPAAKKQRGAVVFSDSDDE